MSPLLREFHWLCVPERIDFRLAVLVYRCINGTAPRHLASELQRFADIEWHGRLRSLSTALLHVPRSLHHRSCLPRCRCESLKHAITDDHVTAVTAGFQACTEDGTVSQIVRQSTLAATAALTLA